MTILQPVIETAITGTTPAQSTGPTPPQQMPLDITYGLLGAGPALERAQTASGVSSWRIALPIVTTADIGKRWAIRYPAELTVTRVINELGANEIGAWTLAQSATQNQLVSGEFIRTTPETADYRIVGTR